MPATTLRLDGTKHKRLVLAKVLPAGVCPVLCPKVRLRVLVLLAGVFGGAKPLFNLLGAILKPPAVPSLPTQA